MVTNPTNNRNINRHIGKSFLVLMNIINRYSYFYSLSITIGYRANYNQQFENNRFKILKCIPNLMQPVKKFEIE